MGFDGYNAIQKRFKINGLINGIHLVDEYGFRWKSHPKS